MYDFKKYDDLIEIKDYDGFISPEGYFYKVKKRRSNVGDHNVWAEQFIRENNGKIDLNLKDNVSMLFSLSKLSGPSDILVHLYGYIYYSHDGLLYKPIIKLPNRILFNKSASNEALDMLFDILIINNEKAAIKSIFEDENLTYSGLDNDTTIHRL